MKMKLFLVSIFTLVLATAARSQEVKNTSYITSTGEKVLRLESILPVDKKTAWEYFTTDEKLKKWIAPVAHIELKTGGYIVTNYDKDKPLSDASSIRLDIINYLEGEMLTMKVKLNDTFPKQAQAGDQNLQEIIQLTAIDATHTKVTASMIGWGTGPHWDKTYDFFVKGNTWTYNEILKLFK
jgi:hypothetical protein